MTRYRSYIVEDPMTDPFMRVVRLLVVDQDVALGRGAVLMPDGTWQAVESGTRVESGLLLPAESIEAIGEGIERWQGKANHAATESAVLREWLAVERGRVDRVLVDAGLAGRMVEARGAP